jgi:hypothetical protein
VTWPQKSKQKSLLHDVGHFGVNQRDRIEHRLNLELDRVPLVQQTLDLDFEAVFSSTI